MTQNAFKGLGRVAPRLAVRTAEQLFFKTRRFDPKPGELETLTDATPVRLDLHGQSLATWVWPAHGRERGTVALVHGWNGRATQLGAFVSPLRDAGYRVVAFDNIGHGRSAGGSANLVSMAEALLVVAKEHGPFDGVIAHSMGGPVTSLAIIAGLQAKRLSFISPPFSASKMVEWFVSTVGLDRKLEPLLRKRIERRVGVKIDELSADHVGAFVKQPVLVIHDRNDREISYDDGVQVAWSLSDARLRSTEGLGHQRILRDADVVNDAVTFVTAQQDKEEKERGVS